MPEPEAQLELDFGLEYPLPAPSRRGLDGAYARLQERLHPSADGYGPRHKWPATLALMVEVALAEARRHGVQEVALPMAIVRAIADQLQGWIYLPSGEHIARSLRDAEIWAEFNGRNGRELAQKYHRHPEHIAKILREQRKLEKWRRRGGDGGR